jgi:hypothetical protein
MSTTADGIFSHHPLTLFAAGAVAVLVFHQGLLTILHLVGVTGPPFQLDATWPFGLPQIWSLVFWGGLWGIAFGAAERRFPRGTMYWVAAFLFGAVLPTLVAWFVVAPLKGAPVAAGWDPAQLWIGPVINGAWGIGTALLLVWRGPGREPITAS